LAHSKYQSVLKFLDLKTSRSLSIYQRILLEIRNNLYLVRLSFGTTPNTQKCWVPEVCFPPVCLRQSDGRRTPCQYILNRRHGLAHVPLPSVDAVCYSTYIVSIYIVKLNKTATNGEAWKTNWRPWKGNGTIKKRGQKLPHRRQYTDPNTFHIMSNLVSFL